MSVLRNRLPLKGFHKVDKFESFKLRSSLSSWNLSVSHLRDEISPRDVRSIRFHRYLSYFQYTPDRRDSIFILLHAEVIIRGL